MKTLPIVLFFSGFLIQFAALLGEHLTEIPSALKIVAPSYCRARIGIETLLRERRLANTNEGFEEISRLLIWNMYEINHMPKDRKTDFKVDAIAPVGETVSKGTAQGDDLYTPDDVRCWMSTVTNHFVDSVGHIQKSLVFEYHQSALREKIEELKQPNILRFCFGMFPFGFAVETVAFFWERSEAKADKHKNDPSESNKTEEQA